MISTNDVKKCARSLENVQIKKCLHYTYMVINEVMKLFQRLKNSSNKGFALISTLSIVVLLAFIAVGLLTLSSLSILVRIKFCEKCFWISSSNRCIVPDG